MRIRGAKVHMIGGTVLASASGAPYCLYLYRIAHPMDVLHAVVPYHATQEGFTGLRSESPSLFHHEFINLKRVNTGLLAPLAGEAPVLD